MAGYDVLILYSGGLESRYLLHIALESELTPLCLLVDYGQKHIEELKFARQVCQKLNIGFLEATLPLTVDSGLTGDNKPGRFKGVSEWYVPARNLMFVALAAGIAESWGIEEIWIGASYEDRLNEFPDCSQEWVVSVNETLQKSLSNKKIRLGAPLLGFTKKLVWALSAQAGIDEEEVFSGYGE